MGYLRCILGYFNPRSPCGERPALCSAAYRVAAISIHAPRVGSDTGIGRVALHLTYFNPRSPCGERPTSELFKILLSLFQSTLPVWGATRLRLILACGTWISIHAPRVGSDKNVLVNEMTYQISIHAPRVGSDSIRKSGGYIAGQFQSTLPVWGATRAGGDVVPGSLFQSTLPVWGATETMLRRCLDAEFQSTLPVWGATCYIGMMLFVGRYFNPRSPCGERLL